MTDFIDISVALHSDVPVWPGSPGYSRTLLSSLQDGSDANVSEIRMDVHTGTHVDAPAHFLADGDSVEELGLDVLMGPVTVVEIPEGSGGVGPERLEALNLPQDVRRVLLRTHSGELWARTAFDPSFAALSADGAAWVVDRGIHLVGIDYLSIQRYRDPPLTHRILLDAGVVILEGLDLSRVPRGEYELVCLPLALVGAEAAPARAILRRLERN